MEHPIQTFINQLFEKKPEQKRIKWAQLFIDEEFDTVEELKQLSDENWNELSRTLPSNIRETIWKNLKPEIPQTPKGQTLNKKQNQNGKNGNSENNTTLSQKQVDKIISLINKDWTPEQIVDNLDAKIGTPRGDAIFERIQTLIRPPKPCPVGEKPIVFRKTQQAILPLFLYHGRHDPFRRYYTFLVIGQTGTGKTTLLDAFVNKLTGMEYTDNWRWKLVDESHLNQISDGQSKTSTINIYYINDHLNQFNIRIIDTPGFGDTSGIQTDNKITDLFRKFFNELPQIDYILLTVKATETRQLAGSKYVYDKVQQLFSLNTKDRFILMCTFADSNEPQCLKALSKDIVYEKYFKFNNSAIYTPSAGGDHITKLYWKMAIQSIEEFSKYVISSNRLPLSLKLSCEQLEVRRYLEQDIHTSQQTLNDTWKELDVAKTNFDMLKANKEKIEKYGKYTDLQPALEIKQQKLNAFYQLCRDCGVTCCQSCRWDAQSTYSQCSYFRGGSNCPCCPGKCSIYSHVRTDIKVTRRAYTKQVVVDFKKKMYDQGLSGAQVYCQQLKKKMDSIDSLASKVMKLSIGIKQNLKKLESIALKPKIYSDLEFYEQMIKQEQDRKEKGYTDRVKVLKGVVQKVKALAKINNLSTNFSVDDFFPQLKDLRANYQKMTKS